MSLFAKSSLVVVGKLRPKYFILGSISKFQFFFHIKHILDISIILFSILKYTLVSLKT